ncbi:carbohydrate-binding family 9-like protein [Mucilaginibacter sp.]|uniref:carbohydrate-binding family 9-like protein n=1 Tax=Mucilaginibacter sp. TaxID=1882438 RepID=UPI003D0AB3F4
MNTLKVPFLPDSSFNNSLPQLSDALSQFEPVKLNHEPWPTPGVKPQVEFFLAYGDDALFLKFNVKEKHFRATFKNVNDLVYKDSCVEFFIGFGNAYYNFEFNALGTPYVAYGLSKQRETLPVSLINNIKSLAIIKDAPANALPFEWEITAAIPFNLFYKHNIQQLKGTECRANFYKCGDELPEPHYLSWNNIIADQPAFHLPEYFGKLIFV